MVRKLLQPLLEQRLSCRFSIDIAAKNQRQFQLSGFFGLLNCWSVGTSSGHVPKSSFWPLQCARPGREICRTLSKTRWLQQERISRNQIPGWNFLFWLRVVGICRLCPVKSGIRWSPSMRNCPRFYSWNLLLRHQSQTHTVIFARVIDKMTFLPPSAQVLGAEALVKSESEINSLNQPWHVELRRFNQWSDVAVPFVIFQWIFFQLLRGPTSLFAIKAFTLATQHCGSHFSHVENHFCSSCHCYRGWGWAMILPSQNVWSCCPNDEQMHDWSRNWIIAVSLSCEKNLYGQLL